MTDLRLFTSESVTEGHPDKICDQISDSILDALLTQDPTSRAAVETLVTTGLVHVAGELDPLQQQRVALVLADRLADRGRERRRAAEGAHRPPLLGVELERLPLAVGEDHPEPAARRDHGRA